MVSKGLQHGQKGSLTWSESNFDHIDGLSGSLNSQIKIELDD